MRINLICFNSMFNQFRVGRNRYLADFIYFLSLFLNRLVKVWLDNINNFTNCISSALYYKISLETWKNIQFHINTFNKIRTSSLIEFRYFSRGWANKVIIIWIHSFLFHDSILQNFTRYNVLCCSKTDVALFFVQESISWRKR